MKVLFLSPTPAPSASCAPPVHLWFVSSTHVQTLPRALHPCRLCLVRSTLRSLCLVGSTLNSLHLVGSPLYSSAS